MSKLKAALAGVQAPSVSLKGVQGMSFQAQRQEAKQVQTRDYSGQLVQLAQLGSQAVGQYVEYREKEGKKKRDEILMKNMSPEQIGDLRQNGILLYQDDPYAMRALNRELGRQEAYSVESTIRERISNGDYPTRSAMEIDRARMMEDRRKEMGDAFALADEDEGWNEGWQADMVERNMAIYDAQARKEDQANRNSARVAIESNIGSLTRSGNGASILDYLNQQRMDGVIRNDSEFETYLTKGIKELASRPNSIDSVRKLMDSEVSLHGQKTNMRSRLGEEYFRSLENTAASATLNYSWETTKWASDNLNALKFPDFTKAGTEEAVLDTMAKLEQFANQTQGEQATAFRQELEAAKTMYQQKHAAWVDAERQRVVKQQQQNVRLMTMDERVTGRMQGDSTMSLKLSSFEATEQTGEYTADDWNAYYTYKSNQINGSTMSDEEKAVSLLRLGATLKDNSETGFGAHYAGLFESATGEISKYNAAIAAGQEPPATPTLNQFTAFYKADPQLFVATFGADSGLVTDIALSANLGVHPSTMFKGKERLDNIKKTPDQYTQLTLEMKNLSTKKGSPIYQVLNNEQREAIQAAYLGMEGMNNATKIQMINKHLEDQFEVLDDGEITGIVPKTFLMADPKDPKSVSVGKARLNNLIVDTFGSSQNVGVTVVGDNIVITSSLRARPIIYTKEQLMNPNQ